MSIHITFADGSNPYIRYSMTVEEFALELLKWTENYNLEYISVTGDTIIQFMAKGKE